MRKLYQDTFSQVHSSTVIRWEDMEAMRPKKRISKNLIVLAAVVALLAALSAAAVATDFFGLRSILLPQKTPVSVLDEDGIRIPGEVKEVDTVSLSGYVDSAESRATAEWQEFLNGYDVNSAAQAADKNPEELDEKYSLYQVYNREMAHKLDEIVEKYGLTLHSRMELILPDGWHDTVGDFALPGNTAYTGYIYEDGTFAYDGDAELPGYGLVDYQFRRSVKGTFNEVILNIEDVSQYREWAYETACGVPVTLALGPIKGLILTDLGDSFVTVNVLAGMKTDPDDIFSSGPISAEDLEELADLFDFTVLTPVRTPDMDAVAAMEEAAISASTARPPATLEEDAIYAVTGMEDSFAQSFYSGFYRAVEEDRREDVANMIVWPRVLTSEDGETLITTAEEFLPYYDEVFTQGMRDAMSQNQYTEDRADLFASNGAVGAAGGAVWFALAEDGRAEILTIQNPEGVSLRHGSYVGRNVAGVYTDTQGTDEVYSSLELCDRGDGTYDATISLYRLATLDGTVAPWYGTLYFTSGDQLVEATIDFGGDTSTADTAAVTITYSELPALQVGDTFRFADGRE